MAASAYLLLHSCFFRDVYLSTAAGAVFCVGCGVTGVRLLVRAAAMAVAHDAVVVLVTLPVYACNLIT